MINKVNKCLIDLKNTQYFQLILLVLGDTSFTMSRLPKTSRKREPNFTADEKALLTMLIKKRPIIESKLTDGKSIDKKTLAWEQVALEFNAQAHVTKRSTASLKRSWDNLKSLTRKIRANERGCRFQTGGGPPSPPQPPQQGAIVTMVEEAAPTIVLEINNTFDSDGILLTEKKKLNSDVIVANEENFMNTGSPQKEEYYPIENEENFMDDSTSFMLETQNEQQTDVNYKKKSLNIDQDIGQKKKPLSRIQPIGKTADYIKREAVLRIKTLEQLKSYKIQILKTKLETKVTKQRAAALKEELNRTLLEKAKLELEELKKN